MILLGGNVFGFSALYSVLEKQSIYDNYCNQSSLINSMSTDERICHAQTEKYEVIHKNDLNEMKIKC
jgi:hypothetical protein